MNNFCKTLIKTFIFCGFIFQICSCENNASIAKETPKSEKADSFSRDDYAAYLQPGERNDIAKQKEEYTFWEKKLEKTPGQYPYLLKIATASNSLFGLTGEVKYLVDANDHLEKANLMINNSSAGSLRSLARCYITQHRFKDAHAALKKAEELGEKLEETNKMLFDVNMELGNFDLAKSYLDKIEKKSSFDHLIRRSKWEDHVGKLDRAIVFMESALENAVRQKNQSLMMWSYTNLADYYGHAGRIEDSYNHYLKALSIDPHDAYAMKGIAWIQYSHNKDAERAKEILNNLVQRDATPDYLLLLAEIEDYEGNEVAKQKLLDQYLTLTSKPEYGVMYNKYRIQLLAEEKGDYKQAQQIAQQEIDMRPTPQSYDLLAWSQFLSGEKEGALNIIAEHVAGKSYEPELLYHAAEIYKANNLNKKVADIKPELIESVYELGPAIGKKIQAL